MSRNLFIRYHLLIKISTLDHVQAPAPSKGCQLKTLRDDELTPFRNHLALLGRCWYSNVHPIHPYHQAVGRWWNETYEFFDVSRRLKKNGSVKGNQGPLHHVSPSTLFFGGEKGSQWVASVAFFHGRILEILAVPTKTAQPHTEYRSR